MASCAFRSVAFGTVWGVVFSGEPVGRLGCHGDSARMDLDGEPMLLSREHRAARLWIVQRRFMWDPWPASAIQTTSGRFAGASAA